VSRVTIILRAVLSILLTTLVAIAAQAQRDFDPLSGSSFEISGEVRSASNKTLDNVLVRVETVTGVLVDQTTTDGMGKFRFSRLSPGQYRVVANSPGRGTQAQAVDLARSSPRINVVLQLVPQQPTFRSGDIVGVIDARVPSEAKAALEKGRAALAEQKRDIATSYFEKATKIFPDYYEAYMLLGQQHMDASNWQKAEDSFRQAVRINPKAVMALVSLGEAYRRQQKYSEAQKPLEDALRLDNNSWQGNFTLGRIHWELNDIAKAGKYIARTIELEPNVAEAHLLAGNIFIRAGLPTNALVEYEEYLRLAPTGEFAAQVHVLVEKLKKSLPSK
jgi:tetratricopeptide (TPR) repeat protein